MMPPRVLASGLKPAGATRKALNLRARSFGINPE